MDLPSGYTLVVGVPSAHDHHDLRVSAGLSPPPRPDNEVSLRNTWYGVVIQKDGAPVAMGRIVGDGAFFLTIVDICTHPEHQRKGLGNAVMQALLVHVDQNAPNAYLTLLADPPGVGLYKRHGFVEDVNELAMYRSRYVDSLKAAKTS